MDTTVKGELVPETTGNTGTRWEDTPNRHAYCDGEIRRLRAERDDLSAKLLNAHSETRSFLARMDALARELEALSARHAPGARSETEAAVAKRLRAITCTDPALDPPRDDGRTVTP